MAIFSIILVSEVNTATTCVSSRYLVHSERFFANSYVSVGSIMNRIYLMLILLIICMLNLDLLEFSNIAKYLCFSYVSTIASVGTSFDGFIYLVFLFILYSLICHTIEASLKYLGTYVDSTVSTNIKLGSIYFFFSTIMSPFYFYKNFRILLYTVFLVLVLFIYVSIAPSCYIQVVDKSLVNILTEGLGTNGYGYSGISNRLQSLSLFCFSEGFNLLSVLDFSFISKLYCIYYKWAILVIYMYLFVIIVGLYYHLNFSGMFIRIYSSGRYIYNITYNYIIVVYLHSIYIRKNIVLFIMFFCTYLIICVSMDYVVIPQYMVEHSLCIMNYSCIIWHNYMSKFIFSDLFNTLSFTQSLSYIEDKPSSYLWGYYGSLSHLNYKGYGSNFVIELMSSSSRFMYVDISNIFLPNNIAFYCIFNTCNCYIWDIFYGLNNNTLSNLMWPYCSSGTEYLSYIHKYRDIHTCANILSIDSALYYYDKVTLWLYDIIGSKEMKYNKFSNYYITHLEYFDTECSLLSYKLCEFCTLNLVMQNFFSKRSG